MHKSLKYPFKVEQKIEIGICIKTFNYWDIFQMSSKYVEYYLAKSKKEKKTRVQK